MAFLQNDFLRRKDYIQMCNIWVYHFYLKFSDFFLYFDFLCLMLYGAKLKLKYVLSQHLTSIKHLWLNEKEGKENFQTRYMLKECLNLNKKYKLIFLWILDCFWLSKRRIIVPLLQRKDASKISWFEWTVYRHGRRSRIQRPRPATKAKHFHPWQAQLTSWQSGSTLPGRDQILPMLHI